MRSFSPSSRSLRSSRAVPGSEMNHPLIPLLKSPLGTSAERAPVSSASDIGLVMAPAMELVAETAQGIESAGLAFAEVSSVGDVQAIATSSMPNAVPEDRRRRSHDMATCTVCGGAPALHRQDSLRHSPCGVDSRKACA